MKILAILAALFLSIGYGHAQTYEKFVEKSFDFLDKNDLVSAEESLRAAMRLEPGNPNNYALLMNLGTIQRRQGKLEDALLSYTAALSRHPNNEAILEIVPAYIRKWVRSKSDERLQCPVNLEPPSSRGVILQGDASFAT